MEDVTNQTKNEPQRSNARRSPREQSKPARQWERLSFTGDPDAESSVGSAIAAAEAAGDLSIRPWTDDETASRAQVVAIGPQLTAIRTRRTAEEAALTREISRCITDYREAHHLSQRELASKLDLPQPILARLELGLDPPTLENLATLSRGLGVTFDIQITPNGIRLRDAA
jgi:hypothetical protein